LGVGRTVVVFHFDTNGARGGKGWRETGLVVRVGRTMVGKVVMWKFEKEVEKKFTGTSRHTNGTQVVGTHPVHYRYPGT
jgi:hypothetical protein